MENRESFSDLFERLNDLKSVFRYGQKLIPIIQSLLDFMRETVPLLENINSSISDSTSKIPKATLQIDDVTSATELATTEILDKVDSINLELNFIIRKLVDLMQVELKKQEIFQKLRNLVQSTPEVSSLMEDYEKLNSNFETIPALIETLKRINEETNNITLSLQVQDITSQQLASVNHLIFSVQQNLSSLISDFEKTNMEESKFKAVSGRDASTFDAEASYTNTQNKQNFVDSLVIEQKQIASQDEIDKLFS